MVSIKVGIAKCRREIWELFISAKAPADLLISALFPAKMLIFCSNIKILDVLFKHVCIFKIVVQEICVRFLSSTHSDSKMEVKMSQIQLYRFLLNLPFRTL